MDLGRFPRVSLSHLPTPLERLDRLTDYLNGPEIWIKRDDCTGLATGGNKARKLEFLAGEARAAGADMVVTHGATQSNHTRQTAAAAGRLGMRCHLILEDRTGVRDAEYTKSGNVLLDHLHGARIEYTHAQPDMNALLEQSADRLRAEGHKVYVIPGGGSNPVGALGYVKAAMELSAQTAALGLKTDHIVHATGSAGTQAGLVAGLAITGSDVPVLGIGVRQPKARQEEAVFRLATATASFVGHENAVKREKVVANCDYIGSGYGLPTEATIAAIHLLARLEGILLDPVYSGKAMAGLIDLVRRGRFGKGETIVFIHTGGSSSLFAYRSEFPVETDGNLSCMPGEPLPPDEHSRTGAG